MSMPQVKIEPEEIDLKPIESDEIDLQPIADDTTRFSDDEKIPVERVNFEFEQSDKLRGMYRKLTVFNDEHCYQSIKNKHRRKYKFRLNLAFLDPRPFRLRNIAWKWLCLSLAFWCSAAAMVIGGWFDASSVMSLGIFTGVIVAALLTLLSFFYLSHDTVYFRSQFGKIRLFELANNDPNRDEFRKFINQIVVQINKSKAAKGMNQSQLLAAELKELRRLKNEDIVLEESYEKAKRLIFRHGAFKASE